MRRNRLIVLLAAGALLICSALYSAHGLADLTHSHSHCDLCVHLGGSAGTPAAAPAGKPPLALRAPPATPVTSCPVRIASGLPLPRGPPARRTLTV